MITSVRSRLARLHGRDRGDGGFSILEVMISFTIFVTVAASAGVATVTALKAAHSSQQRIDAGAVAQTFIADAQAKAATIGPEGTSTSGRQFNATLGGEHFQVQRWITFVSVVNDQLTPTGGTQCSAGGLFSVNVAVYQQQAGKTVFLARSDSVISC